MRHGSRAAGVTAVCAVLAAALAPAAFGAEETGDAGNLPGSAERIGPPGALTSIRGTFDSPEDQDVFEICLTGGSTFSATTVGGVPETGIDTQLFLLRGSGPEHGAAAGNGVYAGDDTGALKASTLPAGHVGTATAGAYHLAISLHDVDPIGPSQPFGNIFPNRSTVANATRPGPMIGWTGTGGAPLAPQPWRYEIFLTGARSCIPPDQEAPGIQLRTPAQNAVFGRGEIVAADFECVEEEGGSGLETCAGTVADGLPIDTATLGPKTFTVTTSDRLGNERTLTHNYTVVDRSSPLISIASPLDGSVFSLNQPVFAAFTCSDEAGGSGIAACDGDVAPGARVDTATPGPHTFTVRARDVAGNTAQATALYRVLFDFDGFLRPLVNPPGVNSVKAGRTVPVKFTLNRYRREDAIADGYPRSGVVPCGSGQNVGAGEPARGGHWAFPYKRGLDFHIFLWRTDRRWAGTCRQFVLKLVDGSEHRASFRFTGRSPRPPKPDKPGKPGKPHHDDDDRDDDDRDDDDSDDDRDDDD